MKKYVLLVFFLWIPFVVFTQIHNLTKIKSICYLDKIDSTSNYYVLLVHTDTTRYTILQKKNNEIKFVQKDSSGIKLTLVPIHKVYFECDLCSDKLPDNDYYQNSWGIGYYRAKGLRKWKKKNKGTCSQLRSTLSDAK